MALHVVCDRPLREKCHLRTDRSPCRCGLTQDLTLTRRGGRTEKAREIWFLCRKYTAQEALDMGLVNKVVPLEQLEDEYAVGGRNDVAQPIGSMHD